MFARNSKHSFLGIPGALGGVNLLAALVSVSWCQADEVKPKARSQFQAIVGADGQEEGSHWDQLFKQKKFVFGTEPSRILKKNLALLPKGRALDLAMGEGRNAIYLASEGWEVVGVDYSEIALRKAKQLAHERHVNIETVNADLTHYEIPDKTYDLILSIDYMERSLISKMKRGLKAGGVAVLEIPTQMVKGEGEIKKWFEDFSILLLRTEGDHVQVITRKKKDAL